MSPVGLAGPRAETTHSTLEVSRGLTGKLQWAELPVFDGGNYPASAQPLMTLRFSSRANKTFRPSVRPILRSLSRCCAWWMQDCDGRLGLSKSSRLQPYVTGSRLSSCDLRKAEASRLSRVSRSLYQVATKKWPQRLEPCANLFHGISAGCRLKGLRIEGRSAFICDLKSLEAETHAPNSGHALQFSRP